MRSIYKLRPIKLNILTCTYLDSPGTTSSTTYSIQVRTSVASASTIGDNDDGNNLTSELTLIEVAA